MKERYIGFRGWFYLRQGWSNYLTFFMASTNTLTVTYFLAIERYPFLEPIFPSFVQYVLITVFIGIPLLIIIGYAHWKKSAARKAEVDIYYETNPYIMRILVNTEMMMKLNLELTKRLNDLNKKPISASEKDQLSELQNDLDKFVNSRKFKNKSWQETEDWSFFKKNIE
jgi:hypothetical protein